MQDGKQSTTAEQVKALIEELKKKQNKKSK